MAKVEFLQDEIKVVVENQEQEYAITISIDSWDSNNDGETVYGFDISRGIEGGFRDSIVQEFMNADQFFDICERHRGYVDMYAMVFDRRSYAENALEELYNTFKDDLEKHTYESICTLEGGEIAHIDWESLKE